MRICAIMKYPPIQGGVSARCYWLSHALAERGHHITVITNANEVEDDYRIWLLPEDLNRLEADFPNGGSVRVVSSGRFERSLSYIPYANPYVTKLAALATEEIRRNGAEVLFSCYFEPYGMSAQLAAAWTGLPYVVQHAGSDRTRLMEHPELSVAYKEMLRRAAVVVTGDLDLEGLGIPVDRLARLHGGFLPSEFNSHGPAFDFDELLEQLPEWGAEWTTKRRNFDREAATIGIYGKVGEAKGSYDLIASLAQLHARGRRFNLVALVGGRERAEFASAIRTAGLDDTTWMLPFIAHWRVPEFIRACTAVCFLERRFPIEIHTPGIPREIMACGTCAVLSEEVARKQPYWSELRHGENAFVLKDPSDIDSLTAVLEQIVSDPAAARDVGRAGVELVQPRSSAAIGEMYEAILQRAMSSHQLATAPALIGLSNNPDDCRAGEILAFLRQHMPTSMRVLDRKIQEALRDFLSRPELADLNIPSCSLAFADALVDQIAQAKWPMDDVIAEVIRFERDRLWLAVDVESLRGLPAFPRVPASRGAYRRNPQFDRLRPMRSNLTRIGEFAIDVERTVQLLSEGNTIGDSTQLGEPQIFLFQKRSSLKGRIFRINQATRSLLAFCDGTRTVAEIMNAHADAQGVARDRLREHLRNLAKEQVIALR